MGRGSMEGRRRPFWVLTFYPRVSGRYADLRVRVWRECPDLLHLSIECDIQRTGRSSTYDVSFERDDAFHHKLGIGRRPGAPGGQRRGYEDGMRGEEHARTYLSATTSPRRNWCHILTENRSKSTMSLHGESSGLSVG